MQLEFTKHKFIQVCVSEMRVTDFPLRIWSINRYLEHN